MAKKNSLNDNDIESLARFLADAGSTTLSALEMCRQGISMADGAIERLVAIQAMLEKSGYLVDRGLNLLGDPGVVGHYDDWLAGERVDAVEPDVKQQCDVRAV